MNSQTKQQESLILKVLDGYFTDLEKGIARIDNESMNTLQLDAGDLIRVRGVHSVVLKCYLRNQSDRNIGNAQNVIRINKQERSKMGVNVGDMVIVRKAS